MVPRGILVNMRWGCICLVWMVMGVAHADRIDQQTRRLRSKSYKVRVSAALQLSNASDDRAVFALARLLEVDKQKSVRQVAALSLGKAVRRSSSDAARSRAMRALTRAQKKDRSSRVRRAARKALGQLARSASVAAPRRRARSGSVFLHVGKPADRTRRLTSGDRGDLLRAVSRTISRHAPNYGMATRKNELPTKAELEKRRVHGFFVGAQVATLSVRRRGSKAEVRCKVAVRVGPWMGKDGGERIVANKTASASGSARVVGSGSKRGIRMSQRDCVVAVAEEITARQVVPFLKRASR